jgi:hypothetical protein
MRVDAGHGQTAKTVSDKGLMLAPCFDVGVVLCGLRVEVVLASRPSLFDYDVAMQIIGVPLPYRSVLVLPARE